ncbi:Hypothetical protein CAP_2201 [Chondromyces apiculatus DSM 436]|uniref:Copper type II ascorbate-dependent monooxygenase C-terminal domain-containing protein n=2 Tax=Chondromyces apiculatus TaxID=51 RepID=A0A017TAL2_9BACT|nr:Hypothetical protein CAP_2201 [Chondromyces apiculatus DSM 436]
MHLIARGRPASWRRSSDLVSALLVVLAGVAAAACGSSETEPGTTGEPSGTGGTGASQGVGGAGGAGGDTAACAPSFEGDTLHLAVGATLAPAEERTMCLRWTTPEAIDIHGFVGTLGPGGHHSLLLAQDPAAPDGVAPCSEAEIMDAQQNGLFQMLAGVSYESSGVSYDFPSTPVQVGLHVPAGTQLVFDAHFLNAGGSDLEGCATLDLRRGEPVVARLLFRTILPPEQYGLVVPAHGDTDVSYEEAAGSRFRVVAASSHMHEGGTHFRMSVKETDLTLYETTNWAEPEPSIFSTQKIVIEEDQTLKLDCSFQNPGDADQHFPDQMCVGGMYTLPCTLPGAC